VKNRRFKRSKQSEIFRIVQFKAHKIEIFSKLKLVFITITSWTADIPDPGISLSCTYCPDPGK
jgi:hypothetical protein